MEKSFISPLSNCRMCLDPSVMGFYRVSQKVSDIIPVLRLTPIGTQPSAVSVFLTSPSAVDCSRICRAQTCAHSGIEPSTLTKGFQRMGQKFEKNSNFGPFLAFTSPISQWPLKYRLTSSVCSFLKASRFYSNSNRTSRFNSIRKWRADSKISNRRACHVCRRTINNTHCSTTNFNRFSIATGIYIEFN